MYFCFSPASSDFSKKQPNTEHFYSFNETSQIIADIMDPDRRNELIEKLAQLEVEMDIVRRRMPSEVESLEKLLNSVEELNSLGRKRDEVKSSLKG